MSRTRGLVGVTSLTVLNVTLSLGQGLGSETSRTDRAPHGGADEWSLIFADDFDGDELDPDAWVTCYWWDDDGCTNLGNGELQWYQPENVDVRDGRLVLTARHEQGSGELGRDYDYTSGIVTTGRSVDDPDVTPGLIFLYGYVEMRARFDAGAGLWPAFWLLPDDHESRPEIDIMEVNGAEPSILSVHLHYEHSNGDRDSFGSDCTYKDLSGDWHTYAVEWGPDSVTWYLDGEECWHFTDEAHIPTRDPMYILINLAVGGSYVGPPDEETEFPARFEIDWVKVWQRETY